MRLGKVMRRAATSSPSMPASPAPAPQALAQRTTEVATQASSRRAIAPSTAGAGLASSHVGVAESSPDAQQVADAEIRRGAGVEAAAQGRRGQGRVVAELDLGREGANLALVPTQPLPD